MSEYERIRGLRLAMGPAQGELDPITLTLSRYYDGREEPPTPRAAKPRQVNVTDDPIIRYQRCGGGVRVLRKKIGVE